MAEPKFENGKFTSDENLTDAIHEMGLGDELHIICPVCGSEHVRFLYSNEDNTESIVYTYDCDECNSEFSHIYWIDTIYVDQDGRFNERG